MHPGYNNRKSNYKHSLENLPHMELDSIEKAKNKKPETILFYKMISCIKICTVCVFPMFQTLV